MAGKRKAQSEAERITPHKPAPKGTETPDSFMHRGELFISDGSGGFTDLQGRKKEIPKDANRARFGLESSDDQRSDSAALVGNPEHRIETGASTDQISQIRRARMERDAASGHSVTKPGASGSGVSIEEAGEGASAVDGQGSPNVTDAFNRPLARGGHIRAGTPEPLPTTGKTGRNSDRSSPKERRAAAKTATAKTATKRGRAAK